MSKLLSLAAPTVARVSVLTVVGLFGALAGLLVPVYRDAFCSGAFSAVV